MSNIIIYKRNYFVHIVPCTIYTVDNVLHIVIVLFYDLFFHTCIILDNGSYYLNCVIIFKSKTNRFLTNL